MPRRKRLRKNNIISTSSIAMNNFDLEEFSMLETGIDVLCVECASKLGSLSHKCSFLLKIRENRKREIEWKNIMERNYNTYYERLKIYDFMSDSWINASEDIDVYALVTQNAIKYHEISESDDDCDNFEYFESEPETEYEYSE